MRKKILFFVSSLALTFGFGEARSQNIPFNKYCATDSMTEAAMRQYPDYAKGRKEFTNFIKSLNAESIARLNASPDYTIPIVIHVIHTYGADNISDAQVFDAVRIINEDFSKTNPDTASVTPTYQSIYANVGFEFKLAKKDPNGNCTNGITRTYSTLTNNADNNVKSLIMWDPTKYLNIWVVNSISFGAGGYSYLPCNVPQNIEGVVVLNSQFGSIGRSNGNNFAARTLTHEIGHYMGLPHTWGGSNTPGDPNNCGLDDGIADTPNTIGTSNFSCDKNKFTCNPTSFPFPDNVENYMDYSNCARMFTNGQKAVMVGALTMACRSNLSTQANLVATGTNPGYTATCAPQADFNFSTSRACAGTSVSFTDQSYNTTINSSVTYNWTFPGGTPATSNLQNPQVTYANPGVYDVTLTTSNASGNTSVTKTGIVTVKPTVGAEVAPYFFGFENSSFPADPTDPMKDWDIEKQLTLGWERTLAASATGTSAVRVRNMNMPKGTKNGLITPPVNVTTISGAMIKYKVAYAQRTTASADKLTVYVSVDCGRSWIPRQSKTGSALSTNGGTPVGTFTPNASQWRQETINLQPSFSVSNLMVKFEAESDQGNSIYIDDVEITGSVLSVGDNLSDASGLAIYPNPSNGSATVNFALPTATNYTLEVLTITGQQIGKTLERKNQSGSQQLEMSEITGTVTLTPGVYMVRLQANGYTSLKKAVIF